MAWWFDRPLLSAITRNWDEAAVKNYPERIRRHEESIPTPISEALQNIDAKATGLLTHVSMMIAGLGLIAPLVANHRFEEAIIVGEMAVYLILAVGCLRCLAIFGPRDLGVDTGLAGIGSELLLRRELYALCVRAAIIITMLVVITLPVLYFW